MSGQTPKSLSLAQRPADPLQAQVVVAKPFRQCQQVPPHLAGEQSHPCSPAPLQIPGEHRVLAANSPQDARQVLRHLADVHPSLPLWRQQRPSVSIDQAEAAFDTSNAAAEGTLIVRCS